MGDLVADGGVPTSPASACLIVRENRRGEKMLAPVKDALRQRRRRRWLCGGPGFVDFGSC